MKNIILHCISGPLAGQAFNLKGGPVFIFGRYGKAHFRLTSDPAASQLHFIIDTSENRVRIMDLGSTNGLVINDTHYGGKFGKALTDFVILKDGDSILAGGSYFRVDIDGNESPTAKTGGEYLKKILESTSGSFTAAGEAAQGSDARNEKQRTTIAKFPGVTDTVNRFPDIEGYILTGRIGVGGRGAVYRAVKIDTGEKAAIKVLLPRIMKKPQALETFRREIKVTKQLHHPNIVCYLNDGITGEIAYLALEFANAGNLDHHIGRQPDKRMSIGEAVPLFDQLLEALAYMHGMSLVHKDVKPKNVLLHKVKAENPTIKLSDMGLTSRMSTNTGDDFLPLVVEGGTPAYMPPEQLTEATQSLPQSDVFSAAATFYQMVTGELLYDFKDKDQAAIILSGDIRPIITLRQDLPGSIARVINKALSYHPEDRYADAREMLDAFRGAV